MTKRWLSDSKSRASKKATAIHAKLKAEVYAEQEAKRGQYIVEVIGHLYDEPDKQSRKRQQSRDFRQRADS